MTIIRKFDTNEVTKQKSPFPSFSKKFIFLTVISLTVLIIIEIWASNTVVIYGEKFDTVSLLQQSLSTENQILENEIAKRASLLNIASESAMLGFSKISDVQYIR